MGPRPLLTQTPRRAPNQWMPVHVTPTPSPRAGSPKPSRGDWGRVAGRGARGRGTGGSATSAALCGNRVPEVRARLATALVLLPRPGSRTNPRGASERARRDPVPAHPRLVHGFQHGPTLAAPAPSHPHSAPARDRLNRTLGLPRQSRCAPSGKSLGGGAGRLSAEESQTVLSGTQSQKYYI